MVLRATFEATYLLEVAELLLFAIQMFLVGEKMFVYQRLDEKQTSSAFWVGPLTIHQWKHSIWGSYWWFLPLGWKVLWNVSSYKFRIVVLFCFVCSTTNLNWPLIQSSKKLTSKLLLKSCLYLLFCSHCFVEMDYKRLLRAVFNCFENVDSCDETMEGELLKGDGRVGKAT